MREESRIDSSFGPIRLADHTYLEGATLELTHSHHIPITVMQVLVVSMQVAPCADISCPQFRCFSNYWSWVLCKWVKW
jgi:hypothetical protein